MLIFLLGILVLVLDQLTKQAVRNHFVYADSHPVIDGFFNLVYVRNDGAAWNILSGHSIILILISVVVMVLLSVYRRHFLDGRLMHRMLFGLLIGGIAGNLVDRIRFGWVTDFLDFEFGTYHYPSFNVADSAICIAIGLYVISNFLASRNKNNGQEKEGAEQVDG
ncbi:MAG: signal peptidase II [Pontiellaceae bacterium]|nr:signal peptidase II [Pontiellaceae bacterium]MBN2786337.1 signal peptidase II [Pontiellaceae bacterium]